MCVAFASRPRRKCEKSACLPVCGDTIIAIIHSLVGYSLYRTSMQTTLRKTQGTSSAYAADGHAIARERCVVVTFPVNPGMVDTK